MRSEHSSLRLLCLSPPLPRRLSLDHRSSSALASSRFTLMAQDVHVSQVKSRQEVKSKVTRLFNSRHMPTDRSTRGPQAHVKHRHRGDTHQSSPSSPSQVKTQVKSCPSQVMSIRGKAVLARCEGGCARRHEALLEGAHAKRLSRAGGDRSSSRTSSSQTHSSLTGDTTALGQCAGSVQTSF